MDTEWTVEVSTSDDFENDVGFTSYSAALEAANNRLMTEKWTEARVIRNVPEIKLVRTVKRAKV